MNPPHLRSVIVAALLAVLFVAALGRGQERGAPSPPIEYRLLGWSAEDTEAALREATGAGLSSVADMADSLAVELEPVHHPKLLAAVDRRLAQKLETAGAEGWDAFWVASREVLAGNHLVPAPQVFLKRPRR